jgi:hypothetical protein
MAVDKSVALVGKDLGAQAVLNAPQLRSTINTTSNYTVPAGVNALMFVLAGGGGGGSAGNAGQGGAGGGAGGVYFKPVAVTPGQVLGITIGAGGTGANNSSALAGASGGTSSISVSSTTFNVGGGVTSGNYSYGGQSGDIGTPTATTVGTVAFTPQIFTNFVIEAGVAPNTISNSLYVNTYFGTNSYTANSNNGNPVSRGALRSLTPALGGNLPNTATVNNFHLSGGGGTSGNMTSSYFGPFPAGFDVNYFVNSGVSGVIGGGGAGALSNAYAGAGGGGAGGVGGSANTTANARGAGGGGGLTGAGATSSTANGGAGGTGGGGGGGSGRAGAGGAGGAGACLIYY